MKSVFTITMDKIGVIGDDAMINIAVNSKDMPTADTEEEFMALSPIDKHKAALVMRLYQAIGTFVDEVHAVRKKDLEKEGKKLQSLDEKNVLGFFNDENNKN